MSRRSGGSDARKQLQLAAQIRRSLESTLVGECTDEVLQNISVESVEPAPGHRMIVMLMVHPPGTERSREDVMGLVEASRPLLVRRVAEDVNRRSLPELTFWLVREPDAELPESATDPAP